jgi:3alpha(or 20beta)-hydroxysteroid dehydrogenase
MGASHCRGFHAEGASVVIGDVLPSEGQTVADELGERAMYVPLDVRQIEQWEHAVTAAEDSFGPISVLVNNAAIIEDDYTLGEHRDPEVWWNIIEVNLFGVYLGIRSVTPSMRRAGGGAIVNISSVGGFMAAPGHSAYAASKWGVRGLTKAAALELGQDNIRVNSVHPGITNTAMHAKAQSSEGGRPNPNRYKELAIARMADPDDITRMVMFVASDEAAYSTGSEFIVDGGFLLGKAV